MNIIEIEENTSSNLIDNVIDGQKAIGNFIESTDDFCDTTKLKDFKTNLTISSESLSDIENDYQFKQATDFIKNSCQRDSLFCGEINHKRSMTYKYDNEWKLLITSYVLDQGLGMEDESASFFVLTILKNKEFWFTDILDDLIGEIQVELNGFEDKGSQIIVWGKAYPYFKFDYGKFRLIIDEGMTDYEFQCRLQR
jgi:hypothetical protein